MSWLAATEGRLSLAIWPEMRQLAHQEVKGIDPEQPLSGELCYDRKKGLWLPFQEAARSAVANLKRRWQTGELAVPEPAPITIIPEASDTNLRDPNGELVLWFEDLEPVVPGVVFAMEHLEEIEQGIADSAKRRIAHFNPDKPMDLPSLPTIRKPKI